MSRDWGVFLDRDGTLVPDRHHPVRPEQLNFYQRTGEALKTLRGAGARLLVVSNQSAVARGLLTPAGLDAMDRRLRKLARDHGGRIDQTYYCPHHPDFTGSCVCRKPKPGLIRQGLREFSLKPRECFLVGDTITDMEAGRGAGLKTVLVLTGRGRRARGEVQRRKTADKIVRDIGGATVWILEQRKREG